MKGECVHGGSEKASLPMWSLALSLWGREGTALPEKRGDGAGLQLASPSRPLPAVTLRAGSWAAGPRAHVHTQGGGGFPSWPGL